MKHSPSSLHRIHAAGTLVTDNLNIQTAGPRIPSHLSLTTLDSRCLDCLMTDNTQVAPRIERCRTTDE
jgi:hypothetical protein